MMTFHQLYRITPIAVLQISLLLFCLVMANIPEPAGAANSGNLSWTANQEQDLSGYDIFIGDQDGVYNHPDSPISVGTITSYDFPPGTLTPGVTYYFALKAKDTSGNLSGLSPQEVGSLPLDTTPPTVNLTNPSQSEEVTGIISISATAFDDVAVESVQFLVNDFPFGSKDTLAPYSIPWDTTSLLPNSYDLKAIAKDSQGNEATSETITVSVAAPPIDNSFPSVGITSPNSGSQVSGIVSINATASDNIGVAGVRFLVDDVQTGTEDTTEPYSINWNSSILPPASYNLKAIARDIAGNETTSTMVPITVVEPPTPAGPQLSQGIINNVTNTGWTTVSLGQSYASMVVVATVHSQAGQPPLVTRIRNANGNSFEIRVDRVDGLGTSTSGSVQYICIEEGVYTQAAHGIKLEAVKIISTTTDHKQAWNGQAQNYSNTYSTPVVLGQVMTYNDADHSVFWSRGANATTPPSSTTLFVGKHVGEAPDTTRADETLGYIIVEAGAGSIGSTNYFAAVGTDKVKGIDDSPGYGQSLTGLVTVGTAIASSAAMDGKDGGWPVLYGATPVTPTTIYLAIQEDQLDDSERSHTSEQVSFLVLENAGQSSDTTPPTVSISTPSNGDDISGVVAILASAADNIGVEGVQFFVNNTPLGTEDNTAPYSTSWDTTSLLPNSYDVKAVARDSAGNTTTSATVTVSVSGTPIDNSFPLVSITAPASGDTVNGVVTIDATASDNIGVVGVRFLVDGIQVGQEDTTAPFSISWNTTTLTSNSYDLKAVARDAAGNETISNIVPVSVEAPPTPGGLQLAQGVINNVTNTVWTTVPLGQAYASMVVVATVQGQSGQPPLVPRIRNANGNSFEILVDRADGLSTAVNATVQYLCVEEGVYTQAEHGVKLEAVKINSSITDHTTSWNGQGQSYSNSYSVPVVLGQVMTYNDSSFSVFWARGSGAKAPPSASTFFVGKHVGEDPNKTRANETIGYVVFEAGAGNIGTMSFFAGLGGNSVKGIDDSPSYKYSVNGLSTAGTAIVSTAGMNGKDGGWPILYGQAPISSTELHLAIQEDQMKDSERRHTSEQIGFVVFEGP